MTNIIPFDRRLAPPQFDTAVRSLSTLRKPKRDNDDGTASRTLLADVQQAVRTVSAAGLGRVASPNATLPFQPRFLLSLLVYCYVTETFSSMDIEELMRNDAIFRARCSDELPSARLLRRFRRDNHAAVRDAVFWVLCRQSERFSRPEDIGTSCWLEALMEQADGRILKAMFIDQMENET
jgi:hypothetical protein